MPARGELRKVETSSHWTDSTHRDAAGDDVNFALERAGIKASPTTPAELLELFNCILEIRTGEDDAAEIRDEVNIDAAPKKRKALALAAGKASSSHSI